MPHSKVHEKTSLNLGLFSPKLRSCCNCGTLDCVMACVLCDCGRALGGEIAYEEGGILKDSFLPKGVHSSNGNKRMKKYSCSNVLVGGMPCIGNECYKDLLGNVV